VHLQEHTLHDVIDVGRLADTPADEPAKFCTRFQCTERAQSQRHVEHFALRLAPARTGLCPADECGRHERLGARRPPLHQGVAVALQIQANVLESGIAKHSLNLGDERGARNATGVRLEIVPHGSRDLP
jgi:hypothetical protein